MHADRLSPDHDIPCSHHTSSHKKMASAGNDTREEDHEDMHALAVPPTIKGITKIRCAM